MTAVHAVAQELTDQGFGAQLLAAPFRFDGGAHPVYWIYGFKRGAFWPFVPTGEGQNRDNATELELKAKLEEELPIEQDLTRWLAPLRRADLSAEPSVVFSRGCGALGSAGLCAGSLRRRSFGRRGLVCGRFELPSALALAELGLQLRELVVDLAALLDLRRARGRCRRPAR